MEMLRGTLYGVGVGPEDSELDRPGTKVLMKAGKAVPRVLALPERKGLLEKTSLVCGCCLPGERVLRALTVRPKDVGNFATFIVKE